MNSTQKKIGAVIVVVILIVAALAVMLYYFGGDEKTSLGSGRVLVYGNADNDDYLDDEDLEMIQSIVDSGTWDSDKYPYADANYDGKVNQDDVTYLQNILDGNKAKMYYVDYKAEVKYFNYPLGDKKIAVSSEYGLMLCEVLGIYDKITAGSDRVLGYKEERYPGCTSLYALGSHNDYGNFTENILASGCQVLLGQLSETMYDNLHDSNTESDHVLISASAAMEAGIDVVSGIMTLGIMFDCGDAARKYAAAYDEMNALIEEGTKGLETYTLIIPYNTRNSTQTSVDTLGSDPGSMFGDVWTILHLPFKDIADHTGDGFVTMEIESIIALDPDVLIISMWASLDCTSTVEEGQSQFETMASYFRETNAYKNGMVFGVNYETIGTYLGMSALALLASYIWPDSFDEEEGWELLESWYDEFTVLDDNIDVREAGGLIVYKMSS